jgi:hypothetical protein
MPSTTRNNMISETQYEADQIQNKLIGFKIVGACHDENHGYFGFVAQKGKKTLRVWVDRDPEGNGAGHLSIEEFK